MSYFASAFECELKKIMWRPKYRVVLVLYAGIAFLAGLIGMANRGVRAVAGFSFSMTGPDLVLNVLSVYRVFLLPLAIFMLASDVFAHELETKSIKCVLTRPVSRLDAYLAKCSAILCYTAIALGVGFVVSQAIQTAAALTSARAVIAYNPVLGSLRASPAQPPAAAASLPSQLSQAAEALLAYVLTLAPMAAFIAFSCFISNVFRSPALVMFLCIVSYIGLSFAGTFNSGASAALFTAYSGWYRMWLGIRLPWGSLAGAAGLLLSTCVIFFGLGFFIFDKKDI